MNKKEEKKIVKDNQLHPILRICLEKIAREKAEKKRFLDSMLEITGGRGFTIIVDKSENILNV